MQINYSFVLLDSNIDKTTTFTINTFKYHVSCTDGKISVGIISINYFSTVVSLTSFLSCRPFVVNATFSTSLVVPSDSWLGLLTVGV